MRNASIHAAAVVIADRPLTDIVPLQLADAGAGEEGERAYRTVTQFSMKPIEEIGLLKMDFLGLRNLDVIDDTLAIIERSTGERPDMERLPLDDPATYAMLARGDSIGVFQFESEGMREALKKVRPTEFDDLVALVSLYRPGAMDQIPTYARGKADPEGVTYPDDRLRPILEATKGVILYQEQAMRIATEIAGFSGAKADDLRKAIGKKNRAAMAELRPEFFAGCRASGTAESVTELLWQTNERSADYSFNKSHAACYALISYRTAWLKANHPAEYMAALISSVMDTKDKVPFFVAQAEQMGIEILPPDVNESDHEFVVVDGNIRFGLDAVKGVGHQAVEAIKAARADGGPFTSVWDFCSRVDARTVNRKAIEALDQGRRVRLDRREPQGDARRARAGAGRGAAVPARRPDRPGQRSSTSATRAGRPPPSPRPSHPPIPTVEFDQAELLAAEKEAIGIFVSAHPLKPIREALRVKADCAIADLGGRRDGEWVTVGGIITQARRIRTKKGDPMMFATLDDLEASVELVVFGKAMTAHEAALAARSRRARPRARGPQGPREDVPHRAGGERVRAQRRGGRRRARRGRARRPRAGADVPRGRRGAAPGLGARGPAPRAGELPRRGRGRARHAHRAPGGGGCGSARTTASPRAPACGPSSTRCWAARSRWRRAGRPGTASPSRRDLLRPCPQPPPAQPRHDLHVLPLDAAAGGPRALVDHREPLEARLREEDRAAGLPDLALPERRVAVAVAAQRGERVVDVQRPEAVEPDRGVARRERRVEPLHGPDLVARGEQMAGVEAHAEAAVVARRLEQGGQLLERAAERAARAGGVLQLERTSLARGQRLADHRARPVDGRPRVAALGRAGVEDRPRRRRSRRRRAGSGSARRASARRSSGSSVPQFTRYTAWITVASIGLAAAASRKAAKSSSP